MSEYKTTLYLVQEEEDNSNGQPNLKYRLSNENPDIPEFADDKYIMWQKNSIEITLNPWKETISSRNVELQIISNVFNAAGIYLKKCF